MLLFTKPIIISEFNRQIESININIVFFDVSDIVMCMHARDRSLATRDETVDRIYSVELNGYDNFTFC